MVVGICRNMLPPFAGYFEDKGSGLLQNTCTLTPVCQITWLHDQEGYNLHVHHCENLKSNTMFCLSRTGMSHWSKSGPFDYLWQPLKFFKTVTMFQKLQFRNRNIQWDGEKNLFSHCWVKLCIFMYFHCGHMWSDIHLTCPGCMTTLLFKEIKYLLWEERWYLSELQLAVSWELDVEVLFSYICCIARQHQN